MDLGTNTSAPGFNLTDEAAEQIKNLNCKVGDKLHAELTMTEDGYDIDSVESQAEHDAEESESEPAPEVSAEEDTDEEKILGYKRPEGKRETPPLTSLID